MIPWWQAAAWALFMAFGLPLLLFLYFKYASMGWHRGRQECEQEPPEKP